MKETIDDLAIFGGSPFFDKQLHVGRPNIGNRNDLVVKIQDILQRRWLTNDGPYVQEFERKVAKILHVRHCIAVCNGTLGLEIAIRGSGLTGEVIVPSFAFIALAHAIQWQGIKPVFCDIDRQTHNIDPSKVEDMITPRTTGIIGLHLWGRPCDVDALVEIGQRRNLKVLFDAAHAFGCSYKGRMIGNFGNAEIFSFHATKFVNTFEGGAVVTNDDELAEKLRLMRNFGFVDDDTVVWIGTNGKMSEISAAMGITSLESLDRFISTNYRNYRLYRQRLLEIPGISLVSYDESEICNYQYIALEIDKKETQVGRDQLQGILEAENVLARRYFYPGCHEMEPYRSLYPDSGRLLPETTHLVKQGLTLPTGTAIGPDEISKICDVLELVVAHGREVKKN